MIKEILLTPFIKIGIRLLDDSVPVEILHWYLGDSLAKLNQRKVENPNSFSPKDIARLRLATSLFKISQETSEKRVLEKSSISLSSLNKEKVYLWFNALQKSKLISFKGIEPGAGEVLLWLYEHPEDEFSSFFENQLEHLLRIIEVKRKKALFYRHSSNDYLIENDQQSISILFSKIAVDRKDIRFLNAALKLNDWAFPGYNKRKLDAGSIDYLLALAEAENACKELLS